LQTIMSLYFYETRWLMQANWNRPIPMSQPNH
jgi:hypothetical protein